MRACTVFFSAGEASGDRLAAGLVRELARLRPDWRLTGIGSDAMQEAGLELLLDIRHTSAIGITESLARLPSALIALRRARRLIRQIRPDLFVAVDCQGINLILARTARAAGAIVVYYIPPQNFLWNDIRRGREIVRRTDLMINLFEEGHRFYQQLGARSVCTGHPLSSLIPRRDRQFPDPLKPTILLAAGARKSEHRRFIPLLSAVARRIMDRYPQARFVSPAAGPAHAALLAKAFAREGIPVTTGPGVTLFASADAAVIKSGTMALEAAIAGCPYCVLYRISRLSWLIMARLWGLSKKLRYVSLPNILSQRELAREFLQQAATPQALAEEALALLDNSEYRSSRLGGLSAFRKSLTHDNPWREAAEAICDFTENPATAPRQVVCALLLTEDNLLYAFRRAGGSEDGRWEFPGGQVEPGETPEAALHRELAEELGLAVRIVRTLPPVSDGRIRLMPYLCTLTGGQGFRLRAHSAVRLDSGEALRSLDWLSLDRTILEQFIADTDREHPG